MTVTYPSHCDHKQCVEKALGDSSCSRGGILQQHQLTMREREKNHRWHWISSHAVENM